MTMVVVLRNQYPKKPRQNISHIVVAKNQDRVSPLEKRLFSQVYRARVTRLPAISLLTNEACHKRHEEKEPLFSTFPLFCVATAVAFGFFLRYKSSVYAAGKDECSTLSLTDIRAQRKRKKAVHMEKMRIRRASRENEPPLKQLCQKTLGMNR